jgi:hypothetical protein
MRIVDLPIETAYGLAFLTVSTERHFVEFKVVGKLDSLSPKLMVPLPEPVDLPHDLEATEMPFRCEIYLMDYGKGFEVAHNAKGKPDDMKALIDAGGTVGSGQYDGILQPLKNQIVASLIKSLTEWTKQNGWFMEFIDKTKTYEQSTKEESARKAKERAIAREAGH